MSRTAHPFVRALRDTRAALRELGVGSMFIGGVAVIALGIGRATADIDATILGGEIDPSTMIARLKRFGISPRIKDAAKFAESAQVILLVHEATKIPIDLSIAWIPFERTAIDRQGRGKFMSVSIPLPRVDDLIIYKVTAHRPKDVQDVEELLDLHYRTIDPERIRAVLEELDAAMEDGSLVALWDRLWAEAKALENPPPEVPKPAKKRKGSR